MAEIGFNISKLRQRIVLHISKVLADRRYVRGINRQNSGGTSEDVLAAVSEMRKRRRWSAIAVGCGVINLPGNVVLIQQFEYCLPHELRCMVVKSGIKHVAL